MPSNPGRNPEALETLFMYSIFFCKIGAHIHSAAMPIATKRKLASMAQWERQAHLSTEDHGCHQWIVRGANHPNSG
jgi:hypothetical protein